MANGNQKPPEPFTLSEQEEPKRFVRTLDTDSAALKQGTKPGFTEAGQRAPVAPPSPIPEPPPPPPNFKPPPPPPAPAFRPPPLPTPPPPPPPPPEPEPEAVIREETISPVRSRLVEGSIFPTESQTFKPLPPLPPPPPPPPPPRQEEAPLRTYTSDFADQIKRTDASTISVLAAGSDAGQAPARVERRHSSMPFIVGGILLFWLGIGGVYVTYLYLEVPAPVVTAPGAYSPFFINDRKELKGEAGVLAEAVVASLQSPPGLGDVRLLHLPLGTTTPPDIFHALDLPAPGSLLRNIEAEKSVAGIVNIENGASLFFILSVESYGDTFAGMLAWEPRMAQDLGAFYGTVTGTTTFRDEVLANHDVRTLRNPEGKSVLLYGYWDPKTLIIARDESAFGEIAKRIANSRTSR